MAKDSILLESGTNEVEILEFVLNGQGFGINVAKVQAIEQFDPGRVTQMPQARHSMAGVLLFRERTLPLIDLSAELGVTRHATDYDANDTLTAANDDDKQIVLVLEFNDITSAVLVDGVNRIHRISWEDISPLSSTLARTSAVFTGSVHIEKREILIVDMEKIIGEIFPESAMQDIDALPDDDHRAASRGEARIYMAEDSAAIRTMVLQVLSKAGYTGVTAFDNGQACWDAVQQLKQRAQEEGHELGDYLHLVISDIEMPKMDGLTLCRSIKNSDLGWMKVILFSSLINEQMAAKCRTVGADNYVSKPNSPELIRSIDELCLAEPATV
ncbi:MAG: response regulator [Planctomycetes bacterium]|jgi:two-component system chemotaxis response regulator CheV|nr:response regulator [Planctomycetota bacterium]